jgi:opacity protein-like surface antigen
MQNRFFAYAVGLLSRARPSPHYPERTVLRPHGRNPADAIPRMAWSKLLVSVAFKPHHIPTRAAGSGASSGASALRFPSFNNWLFYGKAGGGWVGVNNPTLTDVTTGNSISISNSNSNSGLLVGGGIEWAFAPNWTARIEYDKLFLDDRTFTVTGPVLGGDVLTLFHHDVQTVTVGINYLFNWWH